MKVFQEVQEILLSEIKQKIDDPINYKFSWEVNSLFPVNFEGNLYSGVNFMVLSSVSNKRAYQANQWFTFKKIKELGGNLKKGSKSAPLLFCKKIEKKSEEEEKEFFFIWKRYAVFNADCIENLPKDCLLQEQGKAENDNKKNVDCEEFLAKFNLNIKEGRPSYSPNSDIISMPPLNSYKNSDNYYSTVFHELIHWSGNDKRLNRGLSSNNKNEDKYAFEELVAEIGSCFLSARFSFFKETKEESVNYLRSWYKALQNDERFFLKAASQAQKAANFLLS